MSAEDEPVMQSMSLLSRTITDKNIDHLLQTYMASAEMVGESISGLKGIALLQALKRGVAGAGPYPNVALFEAANRIMTDLVILYGVKWLLKSDDFPFEEYAVEYGHENHGQHDIMAAADGKVLIGEVFNVAPSFFAVKKASALKKLRQSRVRADYKLIMCNQDAVRGTYIPKRQRGESVLFVGPSGISVGPPGGDGGGGSITSDRDLASSSMGSADKSFSLREMAVDPAPRGRPSALR